MNSWPNDSLLSILSLPYKQIFNAMPGYAMIVSNDFRIIECNKSFLQDFGNIRGDFCYRVLRDQGEKCGRCMVARTFEDGRQSRCEQNLVKKDGQGVHVVTNTVPITNEAGDIAAVMVMYTDITPIISLQDELERSKKRFEDLFNKVPCYISVQDPDLRIVDTNQNFREDFGDGKGSFCYQVYKHRDEPCLNCPVLATFRDGKDYTREEVITSNKGEKINVLVHSTPVHSDKGSVEYVMEMSSDITQIRQLQDQLQSLGLLVGSISHGIKGVLTGLDGGIYVMNTGFKKDNMDRIKKGWDMIQRNVSRIRSMVMDVLYYAKDREPNWEAVDPLHVVTDVCNILESKAKELNIDFTRDFDEGIAEFEADAKALHSMLVNVLENSIDACRTDKNKSEHFINVALRSNADHVIFQVADNGVGMDQETREKLFSLFFSSKGSEGTGLGLFIANKIAQKHGGIIAVESEPGKGAHFSIRIPKRIPDDMKMQQNGL